MSSRVIIPEIVEEGSRGRFAGGGGGVFPRGPKRDAPATGLGSLLSALTAGLVLVAGMAAMMVLGGIFLVVAGVLLAAGWVAARLGGRRRRSGPSVVVRSTRTDGPMGSTVLIEKRYVSGRPGSDGAGRPE